MLYFYILKYVCVNNYSNHLNLLGRFLQCGFGSVRFRFLVFAIGPVRFMFGFGSCGYLRFLVDFGSVRFAVWNILHWYWPFSRRRKSKYILLPARGLLLPARGFMSSGFQRAERAEPGNRKTKTSWNCQCMQFILKKPIFAFFIELKKQLLYFSNQFIGGG